MAAIDRGYADMVRSIDDKLAEDKARLEAIRPIAD